MDDVVRIYVLQSNGTKLYLPFPQDLVIERRFLSTSGQSLDGPFSTTFRKSFDVVTIICLETPNTDVGITFATMDEIFNLMENNSIVREIDQPFLILNAEFNGEVIFNYYAMPLAHVLDKNTQKQVREFTVSFVCSDSRVALNGYLLTNPSLRLAPPITSGKFQI